MNFYPYLLCLIRQTLALELLPSRGEITAFLQTEHHWRKAKTSSYFLCESFQDLLHKNLVGTASAE